MTVVLGVGGGSVREGNPVLWHDVGDINYADLFVAVLVADK